MSVLLWAGIAPAVLVVLAIGLRAVGAARWAGMIRTHTNQLESGRVDAQRWRPSPAHFDAREPTGLPAPVQCYFRTVLTDGQPIIAAATLEMTGSMNMSATAEQWKTFTSTQRIVTRKPGFLWDAEVLMFPGLPAHVEDSHMAGNGRLIAKLFGLLPVANVQGEGEIARGELMRYLAESPWYPTALLPSQGVRWDAADDASTRATLIDGPITLTLLFRFNEAGLISSVRAESRGASVGKDGVMTMLPWDCALADYRPHGGMRISMSGEAAWVRPDGRKVYFVGHVEKLSYEFVP